MAEHTIAELYLRLAARLLSDRWEGHNGDDEQSLAEELQAAAGDWFAEHRAPNTDPHPEAFRGREAAGYEAEQMAAARRLK